MTEHQLNRGRVIEYGTPPRIGFVRDGESHLQLPFYYRDGRFLTAPYIDGIPSFTQTNEMEEGGDTRVLREPRVDDELIYRLMGHGAMARVFRWTYASHFDQLALNNEKPAR